MSELDLVYRAVSLGDRAAFADWVGRVERPIRASLRPFARAVDVESIVQEALLRMWVIARDGTRRLEGENASLRFAIGIARNLARNEARRMGRIEHLPPEDLPEPADDPPPVPDGRLRQFIRECLEALAGRPKQALLARIGAAGERPDRTIAEEVGMTLNTFLQNVVRARKQLAECLVRRGVPAGEIPK